MLRALIIFTGTVIVYCARSFLNPVLVRKRDTTRLFAGGNKKGSFMAHAAVQHSFCPVRVPSWRVVAAFCVALLAGALITFVAPTSASAKPEFAAQTGKPCGTCHQNPAGGGALKPFGEKFKANGNKLSK